MTEGEAQFIASQWHGGQSSSLYAFCSTGTIDDFLEIEIENCLTQAMNFVKDPDVVDLARLLEYVKEVSNESS